MTTFDDVAHAAARDQRPITESVRIHFLEGILRRLPHGDQPDLVLRGSLATRQWAPDFPRVVGDLDFLATFPHDVDSVAARFVPYLGVDADDQIQFDVDSVRARGMWLDSAFPGVRVSLRAEVFGFPERTTIDVGFGDPLVPEADAVSYRPLSGDPFRQWSVHRATLIGWKLHGLAEWGKTQWRPKDLLDLWLLAEAGPLPVEELTEAIRVAFVSRGYDAADARPTLADPSWDSARARSHWRPLQRTYPDTALPPSPAAARDLVLSYLEPALSPLA